MKALAYMFGYADVFSVCINYSVDESHLTGESDEVKKDPCTRQAMYSGSKLVSGVGRMIVTAVGSRSQAGAIADMVSGKKRLSVLGSEESMVTRSRKEETLLQKRLSRYASEIGKFGVGAALITFGILSAKYTYQHFLVDGLPWDIRCLESYLKHFITGVTILVCMKNNYAPDISTNQLSCSSSYVFYRYISTE